MPFNRDQSTAVRRKGRTVPAAPEARVARASSAANLQVNALLGNFQGQVDNIMRSLTDQLEQEDAEDAGAEPVVGPTEYALATSTGYMDEQEHEAAACQPPSPVRRLLLIDKQVSPHGHLANAALDCVTVVKYDSDDTTLEDLLELIRFAHRKQGFPFTSIACAQHGPNEEGLWIWTSDLVVDLGGGSPLSPITQLTPIVEALGMALEKTRMGRAHIDFLACGLAGFAPRLVLGLEKLYGIDFRASTDDTGNDVNGGDWKMETDNDYDVAVDYLDRVKLVAYTEKMGIVQKKAYKTKLVPDQINVKYYSGKFDDGKGTHGFVAVDQFTVTFYGKAVSPDPKKPPTAAAMDAMYKEGTGAIVYHVGSAEFVTSVLEQGLKTSYGGSDKGSSHGIQELKGEEGRHKKVKTGLFKGKTAAQLNSMDHVYFWSTFKQAVDYRKLMRQPPPGNIIYKIHLPAGFVFHSDPELASGNADSGARRAPHNIPPEWVVGYAGYRSLGEFLDKNKKYRKKDGKKDVEPNQLSEHCYDKKGGVVITDSSGSQLFKYNKNGDEDPDMVWGKSPKHKFCEGYHGIPNTKEGLGVVLRAKGWDQKRVDEEASSLFKTMTSKLKADVLKGSDPLLGKNMTWIHPGWINEFMNSHAFKLVNVHQ